MQCNKFIISSYRHCIDGKNVKDDINADHFFQSFATETKFYSRKLRNKTMKTNT